MPSLDTYVPESPSKPAEAVIGVTTDVLVRASDGYGDPTSPVSPISPVSPWALGEKHGHSDAHKTSAIYCDPNSVQREADAALPLWMCLLWLVGTRPHSSWAWCLAGCVCYVVTGYTGVLIMRAQGFGRPMILCCLMASTNYFAKMCAQRLGPFRSRSRAASFDEAVSMVANMPEPRRNLIRLTYGLTFMTFLGTILLAQALELALLFFPERMVDLHRGYFVVHVAAGSAMMMYAFVNTHCMFIHFAAVFYCVQNFKNSIRDWHHKIFEFREPAIDRLKADLGRLKKDHDMLRLDLVERLQHDWFWYLCGAEFFLVLTAVLGWYALISNEWSAADSKDDDMEAYRLAFTIWFTALFTIYTLLVIGVPAVVTEECAKIEKIVQAWRAQSLNPASSAALTDFHNQLELVQLGFHFQGYRVDSNMVFRVTYIFISVAAYSYLNFATSGDTF